MPRTRRRQPASPTEELLRRAFRLADLARERGNHPFGALLADADASVLIEAENTVVSDADCTGHAEMNLVRQACRTLTHAGLATATVYTSTEPCAMCAGAMYWAGISRVVFGLRESELRALTGADPGIPPWPSDAARSSLGDSARSRSSDRSSRTRHELSTRVSGLRTATDPAMAPDGLDHVGCAKDGTYSSVVPASSCCW